MIVLFITQTFSSCYVSLTFSTVTLSDTVYQGCVDAVVISYSTLVAVITKCTFSLCTTETIGACILFIGTALEVVRCSFSDSLSDQIASSIAALQAEQASVALWHFSDCLITRCTCRSVTMGLDGSVSTTGPDVILEYLNWTLNCALEWGSAFYVDRPHDFNFRFCMVESNNFCNTICLNGYSGSPAVRCLAFRLNECSLTSGSWWSMIGVARDWTIAESVFSGNSADFLVGGRGSDGGTVTFQSCEIDITFVRATRGLLPLTVGCIMGTSGHVTNPSCFIPTSPTVSDSPSSSNSGLIAGAVCGFVGLIALVAVGYFVVRKVMARHEDAASPPEIKVADLEGVINDKERPFSKQMEGSKMACHKIPGIDGGPALGRLPNMPGPVEQLVVAHPPLRGPPAFPGS
jgi:hypothetical protein